MNPVQVCFLIAGLAFLVAAVIIGISHTTVYPLGLWVGCIGLGIANIGFSQL